MIFSESGLKIKVIIRRTFLLILLVPAVVYYVSFLHGIQFAQYILKNKCCRLYRPHFGQFLQNSTRESRNHKSIKVRKFFTFQHQ